MAAPTVVTGILTGGTNSHTTSSEEVNAVATDFISEGIVGTFTNTAGVAPATGAFAVNATGTPDANINISTGVAYVTATPTSQNSQALRVKCTVTGTLAISANASGSTKYDWIYISVSASNAANPAVGADNVATIVASRSTSASTDDGTPPTYGYPIAVVTVANGFTTITNGNIRDVRTNSTVNLGSSSVSSGWLDLGYTPNTVTYSGGRYYSMVFNSVDLTSTLSPGMKLKNTRLVTAPTQCADLESTSSQYFSKTTPSGVTFTDDHTEMAWIKLESYTLGGIIARRNADVEGWSLAINANGQVEASSLRIAANNSVTTSYQSIPLNRWVHVAATTDLSGTSVLIYLDGVLVPSLTTITGTITALVQGTTALVVGARKSAGTDPFDGKIAQAAVFSSVLTAATIRSYVSQTLAGNESTNISTYTLSNSINDSNANANNLTAQGGALATNADSPYAGGSGGSTEYASIFAASFSTNTTLTVMVPVGYSLPTTGGISAVAYSTQYEPFGFPNPTSKLLDYVTTGSDFVTASGTTVQVSGLTSTVTMPPGRALKITAEFNNITTGALTTPVMTIWNGTVVSGVQLLQVRGNTLAVSGYFGLATGSIIIYPAAGALTINVGASNSAATSTTFAATAAAPNVLILELV